MKTQKITRKKIKLNFLGEKKIFLTGFFLTSRACSLLSFAPKNFFWECLSVKWHAKESTDPPPSA